QVGGNVGDGVVSADVGGTVDTHDAVVVSHGVREHIESTGGHLDGRVVTAGQDGTKAASQTNELVTASNVGTSISEVHAELRLSHGGQASAQIFGSLDADTGAVGVDGGDALAAVVIGTNRNVTDTVHG